jgi:hypothetical protein
MEVRWRFYRFDYRRYLELRPALRAATTPEAFAALADSPETQAIVDALLEDAISLAEARQAFVQAACCPGDPLPLDSGFPRFVGALARRRGAEEAAELLTEMAAGGKNLEAWLLPAAGLIGFLTPEETARLYRSYAVLSRRGLGMGQAGRARRGGLLGGVTGFLRSLFDRGPQMQEMLPLLGSLIEEAVENGEGLAAVAT